MSSVSRIKQVSQRTRQVSQRMILSRMGMNTRSGGMKQVPIRMEPVELGLQLNIGFEGSGSNRSSKFKYSGS